MAFKSDIEIAQEAKIKDIRDIAKKIGIEEKDLNLYGFHKAKVTKNIELKEKTKLVLVTAINPTPAGEGKTTVTIGLTDALNKIGKKAIAALREPSLGPVFGVKGGAAGGGYSQVIPMEDINLHFTGDLHAIGAANNLLAAMIDNHIFRGNKLDIDPRQITWRRVVDMNDRQLRNIVSGAGGIKNGFTREDGFDITVASEIMAIFCLAESLEDLKERIGNITFGYNTKGAPVRVKDINAQGAIAALLKDAFNPNLVQTLEGNPVFIHGGPFANIAHGCNSVKATKTAMALADITVTEAGFGADLGAEKFFNIKSRQSRVFPDAIVMVATVKALKYNGGVSPKKLNEPNLEALEKGMPNLIRHIQNMNEHFNTPVVVAINHFYTDTQEEIDLIKKHCKKLNVPVSITKVWEHGSEGGIDLANKVVDLINQNLGRMSTLLYDIQDPIEVKITKVAKKLYRAKNVVFLKEAKRKVKRLAKAMCNDVRCDMLPICIAKTQYSFSDDPKLLGAPEGFEIEVRDLTLSSGAGFIVVLLGEIMKMPGLPKTPAAENIDVDKDGVITGLF